MTKVRSLVPSYVVAFAALLAICLAAGVFWNGPLSNYCLTNRFRSHGTPGVSRVQSSVRTHGNAGAVIKWQADAILAGRPLLPYSVIPGGIASPNELANAIANDPAVAAHYAGFHISEARMVRLSASRSSYVSYRIGGQIYWTAKRVFLPKNEAVITDGAVEARERCGNQISAIPRSPTSSREPLPEAMETRDLEPAAIELPLNARILPDISPGGGYFFEPEGPRFVGLSEPPILFNPPIIPFVPVGPLPPLPPPPPIRSPEPGTGVVLALAFAAWGLLAAARNVTR